MINHALDYPVITLGETIDYSKNGGESISARIIGAKLTGARFINRSGEDKGPAIQMLLEDAHGRRFWSSPGYKVGV